MDIGDKVRDTVTGFRGTVSAYTTWFGGRKSFLVSPTVAPDGSFRDGKWIDEFQLVVDDQPDTVYFGSAAGRYEPRSS